MTDDAALAVDLELTFLREVRVAALLVRLVKGHRLRRDLLYLQDFRDLLFIIPYRLPVLPCVEDPLLLFGRPSEAGRALLFHQPIDCTLCSGVGFGDVRMRVAEELPVLGWIVIQSRHGEGWRPSFQGFGVDRFVRLHEGALAVPPVARVVLVPEGVVDRQGQPLAPVVLVQRVRRQGRGLHPADIREDVRLFQESLPVSGLMCPDDGRVILRLEPAVDIVVGHALDVELPPVEALETSCLRIDQLPGDVVLHPVRLEGREDGVVGAQFFQEVIRDDGRVNALGESLRRRLIEQPERFAEDVQLNLIPDVDVFPVDGEQAFRQRSGAEGDGDLCGLVTESAAGRAGAPVLPVDQKGKGSPFAPRCGARTKKSRKRLKKVFRSSAVGSAFSRSASIRCCSSLAACCSSCSRFIRS